MNLYESHHPTEERGGVSRAHLKGSYYALVQSLDFVLGVY